MIRFKKNDGSSYPKLQEIPLSEILKERKEKAPKDGTYEHVSLTKEGVVPKSERYERDFLVKSKEKEYKITKINDICYNPANLKFGVICRNKYKEGIFSPIYVTFETNDNVLPEYIEGLLTQTDFINYSLKYQEGTVYERMAVSPDDLLRIKVKIPSLEEQQQIVEILSVIDEKIRLHNELVELLNKQKLAIIQRIFDKEISFKDNNGKSYPNWEYKKISDVCEIFKGASLSKANISENGKGTPFILYGELYTTYGEVAEEVVRRTHATVNSRYYSKSNDVVIPTSGENAIEISVATCVIPEGVILAGDLNIFRSNELDGRYFSYLINHNKKYEIARIAQGASIVHTQGSEIGKIEIPVPCREEQEQISLILQLFDDKIKEEILLLENCKKFKKALVQQLYAEIG